jgi:hypothetical protein
MTSYDRIGQIPVFLVLIILWHRRMRYIIAKI